MMTARESLNMPLEEAMRTQRAIRRFRPDPVDDELVLHLIELALKAPTGGNAQNWSSLINPFDPSFWRDPYSHYPSLLAGPPRLLPLLLPTVLVARHRDVVNVLQDYELFSSSSPQLSLLAKLDPFAGAQTMLFSDPPVHTRLRRLVTPY